MSGSTVYARNSDLAASYARGAVVFTWDDGYTNWTQVADMAAARNQRHTFCVTQSRVGTTITQAAVQSLAANGGHEIAQHSKTHANLTQITAAQRADEYDKSWLTDMIGRDVRTFSYPYGTSNSPAGRNATTDTELYLRYDRLLDTTGVHVSAMYDRFTTPFVVRRYGWNDNAASQSKVLELIRLAATTPVTVVIYAHDPAGLLSSGRLEVAMNTAQSLGVPCMTAAEAFPAQPSNILDPGFEDPALGSWDAGATAPNSVASVADTPVVGFGGSRSLFIHQESSTGQTAASQFIKWKPNTAMRVTYRARSVRRTQGTSAQIGPMVQLYDGGANNLLNTQYTASSITSDTWVQGTFDVTAVAGAEIGKLYFRVYNFDADLYVDHVHVSPATDTALG
ncbi:MULTISPECIES: polysaccharide deacetylase family protein [Rhodococcus]|uniref:polysaccharide deacetylase family protein n=1 Tax=Rhodococcus TaxID=1827 RepID=UPI0015E15375|nr:MULTISPECIES: polysaccharide deacetylase family protein [Rhodococcus]